MKEYLKQFRIHNRMNYIMSIVVCLLVTVLNVGIAFLLSELVDVATQGTVGELARILIIFGIYLVVLVTALLLKRWFTNNYISRAMSRYKKFSFEQLLSKNLNSFDKEVTGKYISIFTNDIPAIEENYVRGNLNIVMQVATLIGGIAAMAYLNWILMICILAVSMLPILVSVLFSGKLAKLERRTSDRNENFTSLIKDLLSGFSVVKNFKAEAEIEKIFEEKNSTLEETKNQKRKTSDMVNLFSTVASTLVEMLTFGLGAYFAIKGYITAGTVIAFIQLLNYVLGPIGQLGPLLAQRKAALALIAKMSDTTVSVEDESRTVEQNGFKDRIQFQNVSFGYDAENKVLQGIDLQFEKGKSYVIVGASGSGKSTLVNLMLGQLENYEGSITIDGTDIRTVKNESMYDLFSVIQQNVFVFDNTIEHNITMFKPFADKITDHAIEQSGLKKLVDQKGIDYHCGENGSNLSGGEKQRISIARSLVRKTPILIMDEATSALDPVTARQVETAIAECEDLTRIVISHKLEESVLRLYDKIIVLNNGRVEETGGFDELLSRKGYFEKLYSVSN
ncbi:MAG: ABC transporter ATP-binding protein [Lachnospiraceae bacterium]|nr:ABC transporter ATP-binding protein [Lachnospiraceae bacterium]